ncbi:MAG: hypothetical protein RL742_1120 [Bacteroidota bacterium]|jgi:hypothetical protein
MRRLRPRSLRDKKRLSELLDLYLRTLRESPLQVTLRRLSYDSGIPERILYRLASLHRNPADETQIRLEDYYIVFANIQFRYPTVKMYACSDGSVFFKI